MNDFNDYTLDCKNIDELDTLDILKSLYNVVQSIKIWFTENADIIKSYYLMFNDFFNINEALIKMAEHQIIFTDELPLELAFQINEADNFDFLVKNYYFECNNKKINEVIDRCRQSKSILLYETLYEQTIIAFYQGSYQLACMGLFAILDGIISDISFNTSSKFGERFEDIKKKIDNKIELSKLDERFFCVFSTFEKVTPLFYEHKSFKETEPEKINRHWLMHGRTRRNYTKFDFLKIILALDAFVYCDTLCNEK